MISVVIPTLNEADNLGRLLSVLRTEREAAEIVVADGGSSRDRTTRARDGRHALALARRYAVPSDAKDLRACLTDLKRPG